MERCAFPELCDSAAGLSSPIASSGSSSKGNLARRAATLGLLQDLPMAVVAEAHEVLVFIDHHKLHGNGLGHVDMHLLVATALTGGATLWTRDRRLHAVAHDLGCACGAASPH